MLLTFIKFFSSQKWSESSQTFYLGKKKCRVKLKILKIISARSVACYIASKVKTPITGLHNESVGGGACSQD